MKQETVIPSGALLTVLAGVALISSPGCDRKAAAPADSSKPNVLLVTFDTTRADYLSCYGGRRSTTPTVDAIARDGVRFANCYTTAPITLPAHATIMTGLYPFEHKLRDNGAGVLDEMAVTLAELFQSAGYRTGALVGAYVLHSRYGLRQGFDVYSDEFKGIGAHMEDGTEFAERRADAVSDAALKWLEQKDDRPFFVWVHYFDPHAPYEAPGSAAGGDLHDAYAAEISYADRELARVVQKVEELSRNAKRGLWQIITADHGEGLGEHDEETHGLFTYNTTLQVPLIVKGPGVPMGTVLEQPVSLVDLYPTITELLEFPRPYEVPGHVLKMTPSPLQGERSLYFESFVPFHKYGWSPLKGIIDGQEKLISAPTAELFDLSADLSETNNLASARNDRVAEMSALLDDAQRSAPGIPKLSAGKQEVEPDSIHKLGSLGYVSLSQNPPEDTASLPDPKAMTEVRRKLTNAEKLLSEGDHSGVSVLGGVLEADPGNFKALSVLAGFISRSDFRKELIPLGQARMQKPFLPPFDVEIPAAVGMALLGEGRNDEAVSEFRKVLRLQPDHPDALMGLGISLLRLEQSAEGREALLRATKIERVAGAAHFQLAMAAGKEGDSAEEVRQLNLASSSRPPSIPAIEELAARFLREKNYAEAKRVLREGVAAAPDQLKILNSLAMLLATCPDDSVRDGAASLRLATLADERTNHAHPGILSTLASAQAETGDFPAAIATANRALELLGDQPSPLKGILTQQLGNFKARKPYRSRVEGKSE